MFADAEALGVEFVANLIDEPVMTRVHNPRPRRFVRVWRTGGASVNRALDRPILTFQGWDEDGSVGAAELTGRVRDYVLGRAVVGIILARGIEEVSGLYFDPDPDTGIARYTFAAQINMRAKF